MPLLGAIATGITRNIKWVKKIALATVGLELTLTLIVVLLFKAPEGNNFQLVEDYAWIPSLNIEFLVGIDGISVLFLPMSALLTLMAIIACWNSVQHLQRFHFALLLALEGVTIGVFSALDTMLFFLFSELTLPPIFLLIGLWGISSKRRGAAMKYTLFMLFGGVSLLFAIIILAINHSVAVNSAIPGDLSFSLPVLLETQLPDNLQALVFFFAAAWFCRKSAVNTYSYLAAHCRHGRANANDGLINRSKARRLWNNSLYHAFSLVCCG